MDVILGDVRAVAESMYLSGNWAYIAMIVIAALIGVAAMRNMSQILCVSLLAMLALAAIWVIYGGATSEAPGQAATWMSQIEAGWTTISAVNGATVVGYLLVFAITIAVLYVARSLFLRG